MVIGFCSASCRCGGTFLSVFSVCLSSVLSVAVTYPELDNARDATLPAANSTHPVSP